MSWLIRLLSPCQEHQPQVRLLQPGSKGIAVGLNCARCGKELPAKWVREWAINLEKALGVTK